MSDRFDPIWRKSRDAALKGIPRAFAPDHGCPVLLWVSSDQVRHCLVACDERLEDRDERVASILKVATRDITLEMRGESRYLDIQCLQESGFRIFDYFIQDMISAADHSVRAVDERLREYRHFWQRPRQALSDQEAIGLFGELWFMNEWLSGPTADRLDAWAGGASSALHDFAWSRAHVEVKASAANLPPTHTVGSLDQLESIQDKSLFLFSLTTRRDDAVGTRLQDLYADYRSALDSDPERYRLDELVANRGFRPDDPQNDRFRYVVVDNGGRLFEVRDGFPRIVRASFAAAGPPTGVGRVTYEIELSGFDEFESGYRPRIAVAEEFGQPEGPFDSQLER